MGTTLEERPTTYDPRLDTAPAYFEPERGYDDIGDKAAGWLSFATIMLVIGGIFGLVDGIVALSRSSFYVAGAHFVFSDLNTWGWIMLVAGGFTVVAGLFVLTGSQLARWFGIAMAGLQAIAQLLVIQAYPFWSLCIFAIDLLVIYALAVYGGSRSRIEK